MLASEIIGLKYFRWTVINTNFPPFAKITEKTLVLCRCDCGQEKNVRYRYLKLRESKSCGCLRKKTVSEKKVSPKGQAGFSVLWSQYRHSAKVRNFSFELTKDEFKLLTSSNCFYCGMSPNKISYRYGNIENENGFYPYNGVDRLDNKIGYTSVNSVTCCIFCNKAKGTEDLETFLQWIDNLVQHRLSLNNELQIPSMSNEDFDSLLHLRVKS